MVLWDDVTNENHYISTTRLSLATKRGRMVTCLNELLTIKSHDPFIIRFCQITWQNKPLISPLPQCLQPPNMVAWWLTLRSSQLKSHNTNEKHHISTSRVPMTTKLGRMVTCVEGLLPMKSHDPLIMWSGKITRQTKTIRSSLPQCLWPPYAVKWWHTLKGF